ncbi:hypothetical protein GCM10025865_21150 [Paraoerskovia sediminicola]|uniref:Winged helix DNA-binding domain-containing protein n=1 Tax=Paraoerskovia sediminicola TaxID=1138587 RepID=A0ABM8G3S5_9CELL|nr:crosslink repair DNA glycosylase YcaQ family protein [Paraoerskovia sediminicola]BDZ42816.1 hypothetical protein GCM10025865_21150 [Paraoerskovia sediminicola]
MSKGASRGAGTPTRAEGGPVAVTSAQVRAFRWDAHQLGRAAGSAASTEVDLLDLGVQDSGPDGAAWALEIRGAEPASPGELLYAWTLRGAPHAYRRADAAAVTTATAPYDETDAAKRVFDASRPLKAADLEVLDALRTVAVLEREIVARPTVKGDLSAALTAAVDPPFLRHCTPCDATHLYEMPFRLAALQAGLELEPDASPPVLRRVPRHSPDPYASLAGEARSRWDVVRGYLRFYGPASVHEAAAFVDAPVRTVKAHWPDDVVPVVVTDAPAPKGSGRFVLADDVARLRDPGRAAASGRAVRLAGPFDGYLQGRDRDVLVADRGRAAELWRTIGHPGAVLDDGEVVGTWRPRTSGSGDKRTLTVAVDPWETFGTARRALVDAEVERLAQFRDVASGGWVLP